MRVSLIHSQANSQNHRDPKLQNSRASVLQPGNVMQHIINDKGEVSAEAKQLC